MHRSHFLIGDRTVPIKAELGFDYQLFEEGRLFVGYHHKTLWDVNNGSSPVIDSNYNPSIFYSLGEFHQWEIHLGILEHLSNGQRGVNSRGTNMSYLHFLRSFIFNRLKVELGGKVFASYKIDNGSPDIVDYMGIWAGLMRVRNFASFINFDHSFEFRISPGGKWGTKFSNGNLELGLKMRPIRLSRFNFYLQYFSGRNEYLLDYKVYHQVGRLGISLEI